MALFSLPILFSLFAPALGVVVPAPHIPAITHAPAPIVDHIIGKREAWPESVTSLIPEKVDQRYFSIDGDGNTQAKVSDHFSTVEVSVSKREVIGVQMATAAVGIYSEKIESGATEYSLEVTPDLLKKIENAVKKFLESIGKEAEMLPPFDPKLRPAAEAVADVINVEAGPSLIGVDMGGEPLAAAAAEGALPAGAEAAVVVGAEAIPYVAFVSWMSWTWARIVVALSSSPQLKLPHSVVIEDDKLPNQQDCQGPKRSCKSDTCKGDLHICSIEPHCPCDDEPSECTDEDVPDCQQCTEVDGKCTTGDKSGCECADIVHTIFSDDRGQDGPEYYQYINDVWDEMRRLLDEDSPSKDPSCQTIDLSGLRPPALLSTQSTQRKPKDIMYMVRDTLCSNKCETPPELPSKSVKSVKKGDNGCELTILLSSNLELYGVRDTAPEGIQWGDCYDSFANITEKAGCTDFNPNAVGWVNGPDEHEFFQMGYRSKNGDGKLHDDFADGDEMQQFCGTEKPKCDTCFGGASGNHCSQGDFSGCECEPVTATQPEPPKATNCATAVAAADIICCRASKDSQKSCASKIDGCGIQLNLDAQCQSPVATDGSGTYQVCGQFNPGDAIVRGSQQQDIAECLVREFTLIADLKYQ